MRRIGSDVSLLSFLCPSVASLSSPYLSSSLAILLSHLYPFINSPLLSTSFCFILIFPVLSSPLLHPFLSRFVSSLSFPSLFRPPSLAFPRQKVPQVVPKQMAAVKRFLRGEGEGEALLSVFGFGFRRFWVFSDFFCLFGFLRFFRSFFSGFWSL